MALILCCVLGCANGQTAGHVEMLVLGFTVQELPVRLSNINNLRFAPDGRLTALGYDGRVHLLRDTNGDGLEDRDELFWDQPTITVPVGMVWAPEGLYISSHGKVSLLRDADHDGKADTEEIIVTDWPPTDVGSGGVDATAVTRDAEGNLYFGLLVADYSNAYRLRKRQDLKPEELAWLATRGDKGGDPQEQVSLYDINSPRGTIQKWSVKTRRLETIATGIRVPYTLAFNRRGDLFLTDQEGETWMPNGNPLDELNHIIAGRNYGFPPRHEKWLPNLISEPPVVTFGPQHQSSCGLVFNEPHRGSTVASASQGLFGPASWEGDAFVAGESRGKIWRVRLVKTPAGYVGKETIIARLDMLTTDVTISPRGDLYVSCHSGPPDWGTGPNGEGRLFKIAYTDPKAPQPVATWATGPMEIRVAFDRPIDPAAVDGLAGKEIEFGDHVRAADRLEALKPPYEVVKYQAATPRGKLRIVTARLSTDQTTLILNTDPHPQSVTYALTLAGVKARDSKRPPATVDLDYNLNGVEVTWRRANPVESPAWSGWLPHVDSEANLAFTVNSSEHQRLLDLAAKKGLLEFRSQLQLPIGIATLQLEYNAPFEFNVAPAGARASVNAAGLYRADLKVTSDGQPKPMSILLETGSARKPMLRASYSTDADPAMRPLPLNSFLLPWAPPQRPPPPMPGAKPDMAGGDFARGKELFASEQLKCATCHRLRGEGGAIGPDLSNLVHRDAASVLRDIKDPNASINPDYVAYHVTLRDGNELTGFVRAQNENSLRIVGADGKEELISRKDVKDLRSSPVSLMPAGLADALNEEQVRDLLSFLLSEPPQRTRAEVEQILGGTSSTSSLTPLANAPDSKRKIRDGVEAVPPGTRRPLNLVLVASKQDHGPGEHDYPAWQKKWLGLLGAAPGVTVGSAWLWPAKEQFQTADLIVFYYWNHDWNAERYQQLDEFLARGGGVALFHAATIADKDPEQLAERIGLAAQPQRSKYLHTPFDLKIVAPADHPITRGLPPQIHLLDEPYWPMIGDPSRVEVLATTEQDGKPQPMIWTIQKGRGRVFASIAGHYTWTFDDPLFRVLALRGIAWAAHEPAARFEHLATAGVVWKNN